MPLDRLTKLDPLQLGRFMILARLGAGGMGNVYLAEADDGTPAAVKVIRAELALDPQLRARFRREVEAGRRVDNLCIARYLDADTFAASPWLATEFVAGPTLHHEVFARGPVIGPRVIGLAAGLADALVAIHAAGLVHRDLKPANVLMAAEGPKVIDFGISLAAEATALTTTGMLVGSPAYMSPEQARGMKDVGAPADVFSWASCMTFASRREPPFGEGEAAGLVYRVVHEQPDLAGVPAGLLPFLQAALDKDPAARPTAAELVAGLAAVLDGVPAARLVVPPPEGGPARVVAPIAAPGQAGLILAATWEPDPGAVEAAERTLAEAHTLRASLPPRADERQRRERSRANRAVFGAMLVALLAVLVVAFVTVRPGQTELAKARDNGRGPDAESSTTVPAAPSTAPAGSGAPGASPGDGSPATASPAGAPASPPGATPGGGGPGTTPATRPPASTVDTAGPPSTTQISLACPIEVLFPPTGALPNQLPTAPPASTDPRYSLRVRFSAQHPAGSLVLVRRPPPDRPPPPAEAWAKPVGAGQAGPVVVGPFAMRVLAGATPPDATVTVHDELPGTTFELQLRAGGQTTTCGTLLGPR